MKKINMKKEILAVGTWNGIEITEEFLDEMIANFNELKTRRPVPLRIGHTSDDKAGTKVLAAGWIDSLIKVKDKLVANIKEVPNQIAEFIKETMLKPVSIEFLKEWSDGGTGKIYKNLLTAVAIMGAEAPAVVGMGDFEIGFNEETPISKLIYNINISEENQITDKIKMEGKNMENKELQEKNEEIKKIKLELKEKTNQVEEFKEKLQEKTDEIVKGKLELAKFKSTQEKNEINEFIDKVSTEEAMKILPAEKNRIHRILTALDNNTISFKEESGNEITARKEFMAFIEGLENRVEFKTQSQIGKKEKTIQFSDDKQRQDYIVKEVEEMMKKDEKIDFITATDTVITKLKEMGA